jgi:hypothetical protein
MGDSGLVLEVWTPGDSNPVSHPMPGCTHLGGATWIDADHGAVTCMHDPALARQLELQLPGEPGPDDDPLPAEMDDPVEPDPPQLWIYFVRLADGFIVAEPWPAWQASTDPGLGVVARPGNEVRLHLTRGYDAPRYAWTETTSVAAMFDAATATDQSLERPPFVPPESSVVARAFTAEVTRIDIDATARAVTASPDGSVLVMEVDGGPYSGNVAIYPLPDGPTRRIADNPRAHHVAPRFSADGTAVLFDTAYGSKRSRVVARRVAVPR